MHISAMSASCTPPISPIWISFGSKEVSDPGGGRVGMILSVKSSFFHGLFWKLGTPAKSMPLSQSKEWFLV